MRQAQEMRKDSLMTHPYRTTRDAHMGIMNDIGNAQNAYKTQPNIKTMI